MTTASVPFDAFPFAVLPVEVRRHQVQTAQARARDEAHDGPSTHDKSKDSSRQLTSPWSVRSSVRAQRMSAVCTTTSARGALAGRPGGLQVKKACFRSTS